jgi:uncharacterized protein
MLQYHRAAEQGVLKTGDITVHRERITPWNCLCGIHYLLTDSSSGPCREPYEMNSEDILQKLDENRDTIRSFGVVRLGIFGSYARGEQTETSDLDFLVVFDRPSPANYFDLKFFLETLFGRKVDLVMEDTIKPRIRSTVLEETVYAEGL